MIQIKRFLLILCVLWSVLNAEAQEKPTLSYYLPDVSYNPAVPTPAAFLGFEVGEWHTSHDQLVGYMKALAQSSPRLRLREYGRSHENRPLLCLTITDPGNLGRLEEIRLAHQALADPNSAKNADLKNMPAVWYAGYSIHGNETSGSNAAILFAYYLAAAQTPEVEAFLKNTVVLLDPCFNPDGMQRFSSWVNSRRSKNLVADPSGDEFREPWPQGRTNHYWFDLNRDWLVAQQPESVGRVATLQDWKPNVLTDHHEMGSNSTFFFQPGVPARVNPITPAQNQELTAKIADYHARILSAKKIQFFTRESFDDFYYGKGSTYPDANGGIGILFEQASSRGSAQETENGLLTFPYSIRNHVLTSLSTMQAIGDMRVELNEYLRSFYQKGMEEAGRDDLKAYVFGSSTGLEAMQPLIEILDRHHIKWNGLKKTLRLNDIEFNPNEAVVVPLEQAQYRLIKGIFSHPITFTDSIFYDISAWTLPYAMGLDFAEAHAKDFSSDWLGEPSFYALGPALYMQENDPGPFAFAVEWNHPQSPRALAALLRQGLRVKVAMQPFSDGERKYAAGTIVIPVEKQGADAAALEQEITQLLPSGLFLYTIKNGLTPEGPDLGSAKFPVLRAPKIMLLTGDGVSATDAGEIWHLLDLRYGMSVTLFDNDRFGSANLSKYNVLILPDGAYNLSVDKVREFSQNGGTIIATGAALRWLRSAGLIALEFRNPPSETGNRRLGYGSLEEDQAAFKMPGAIFEASLDLTHPLCFGYTNPRLPMFLGDAIFVETTKNAYATPAIFTEKPLLTGYIHPKQKALVAKSAALTVNSIGRGKIICFPGDPNFRGFWYGTNRLFANALFFGNLINAEGTEHKD